MLAPFPGNRYLVSQCRSRLATIRLNHRKTNETAATSRAKRTGTIASGTNNHRADALSPIVASRPPFVNSLLPTVQCGCHLRPFPGSLLFFSRHLSYGITNYGDSG